MMALVVNGTYNGVFSDTKPMTSAGKQDLKRLEANSPHFKAREDFMGPRAAIQPSWSR